MKDITLLVMAAGMGSRYGGLKQLDAVGPNGETIIDYSVYDAIRAGYTKVVFIIRKDFEDEFKTKVGDKYQGKIKVEYAYQSLDDLPGGHTPPEGREKPWGTGQAILTAKDLISEPFTVINGDDFYGAESFQVAADYYNSDVDDFSMVAFRMDRTLSKFGGVTRGVCTVSDNKMTDIIETEGLQKVEGKVISKSDNNFDGSEPVSMNMWGFTPRLFDYLHEMFIEFLAENGKEMKSEFLIPTVVNDLIQSAREHITVVESSAVWFGVTYKDDKPYVVEQIQSLINSGEYPENLF
ncbi:MAG: sugar phosphate nucleotidyltransferase [Lentisphaeraceae bacterium]|nr:sugar phosphate nucleotidyltransferase [Lentisphaeraceae bacterium]